MTDYELMSHLFNNQDLPRKLVSKRWVRIKPQSTAYGGMRNAANSLTPAIVYNCRNVANQLTNYHEGYFIIKFKTAARAGDHPLNADEHIAPKSSSAFVHQAVVKINNKEIDNLIDHAIFMDILNALEIPRDYALAEESNCFVINKELDNNDDDVTFPTGSSHLVREKLAMDAISAAHDVSGEIKLPLKYISTFLEH